MNNDKDVFWNIFKNKKVIVTGHTGFKEAGSVFGSRTRGKSIWNIEIDSYNSVKL